LQVLKENSVEGQFEGAFQDQRQGAVVPISLNFQLVLSFVTCRERPRKATGHTKTCCNEIRIFTEENGDTRNIATTHSHLQQGQRAIKPWPDVRLTTEEQKQ
jgi:hypothetical protein